MPTPEKRLAKLRKQAGKLPFPFDRLRPFQELLVSYLEEALVHEPTPRPLLASAPTGIGKTAAVLWPLLKTVPAAGGKIFYVTAKTSQQAIVEDTLERCRSHKFPLTSITLAAKEKMCLAEEQICDRRYCPFLRNFLPLLREEPFFEEILKEGIITARAAIAAGTTHRVCPFELALSLAERAEVVVGDYNYVFDPRVRLQRFFDLPQTAPFYLVVDEAHNLYQRSRDYYSPGFTESWLQELAALAPPSAALTREEEEEEEEEGKRNALLLPLFERLRQTLREISPREGALARREPLPPAPAPDNSGFEALFQPDKAFWVGFGKELEEGLQRYLERKSRNQEAIASDPQVKASRHLSYFCAIMAEEGPEFSYLLRQTPRGGREVRILCHDASRFLEAGYRSFRQVTLISATLDPLPFYRGVLGFARADPVLLHLPSPFPRENRLIAVCPAVSTAYKERQQSLPRIARLIEEVVEARPGNYLAFFPSYDYLHQAARKIAPEGYRVFCQQPSMKDREREVLIETLSERVPTLILAIHGGVLAEGVDYPGEKLIGAIMVGPALPRVCLEQELLRAYYDGRGQDGFAYAYLYPGMTRVIQSAGRVIRSERDRGVIVLLCRRFAFSDYLRLLPTHWYQDSPQELLRYDLPRELRRFWDRVAAPP